MAQSIYGYLIRTLSNLSQQYYYLGRLSLALEVLQSAGFITEQPDIPDRQKAVYCIQRAKIHIQYAGTFNRLNNETSAIITLLDAAERFSATDDALMADVIHLRGLLLYWKLFDAEQPDFLPALRLFTDAHRHRQHANDRRGIAEALFYMGLIHQNFGADVDEAEWLYRAALQIAAADDLKEEQAYLLRHLGFIYLERGEYAHARQHLEGALHLREQIEMRMLLPNSHLAVGDAATLQGDFAAAECHYQQALALSEGVETGTRQANIWIALGRLREKQQQPAEALNCYEQALHILTKLNDQANLHNVRMLMQALTSQTQKS